MPFSVTETTQGGADGRLGGTTTYVYLPGTGLAESATTDPADNAAPDDAAAAGIAAASDGIEAVDETTAATGSGVGALSLSSISNVAGVLLAAALGATVFLAAWYLDGGGVRHDAPFTYSAIVRNFKIGARTYRTVSLETTAIAPSDATYVHASGDIDWDAGDAAVESL